MLKAMTETEIKNDNSLLINAWLGCPKGGKVVLKHVGPTDDYLLRLSAHHLLFLSGPCCSKVELNTI